MHKHLGGKKEKLELIVCSFFFFFFKLLIHNHSSLFFYRTLAKADGALISLYPAYLEPIQPMVYDKWINFDRPTQIYPPNLLKKAPREHKAVNSLSNYFTCCHRDLRLFMTCMEVHSKQQLTE